MSERGSIWDKLFQIARNKELVTASAVGLCGLGLFWGARKWLGLSHCERKLLEKHRSRDSAYIEQHISFIDLPPHSLRIFYAQHHLVTQLPKPPPLIVFIHGVGGQINQFEPLLRYFSQVADVLALDLPGCGQSSLASRDWKLYTTEALSDLINRIIYDRVDGGKVILVAHSLGCYIAGRLALKLGNSCLAMVLLCPKAQISKQEQRGIRLITSLPEFVFNIFRKRDRKGGIRSPSVRRMVGDNASDDIRAQQLIWNVQSRTPATLRMLRGAQPLDPEEWRKIVVPTLIVVGEEDKTCPPTEGEKIRAWLTAPDTPDMFVIPHAGHAIMLEAGEIVCDVINDFFIKLEPQLSHAWQLSYTAGERWSLKNEQKWISVQSVSERVGTSPLRAMKTLRQTDQAHSPFHLIRVYPKVRHVIDISHGVDASYDPASFHNTQITYHKFPTVAKSPPTEEDVARFIGIVKECLAASAAEGFQDAEICVHCHYGFNRTGFVICCWLIEEEGYGVKEALEAFKIARPNGIRHFHFISTLHRRYPGW